MGSIDLDIDLYTQSFLLTEEGREQDFAETGQGMQKIDEILPSAQNENAVLAGVGKTLNVLNSVTLGITPSDDSNGGLIAQAPVLFGQHDINQKVIQMATMDNIALERQDEFIPIQASDYYQSASDETKVLLGKGDLYITKEPVTISEETSTYQNFTNGMMNNEADALKNALTQTHDVDTSPENEVGYGSVLLSVNYNPTHGLIGDGLESFVDKNGGTTGMAEQTGEYMRDVTTANATDGTNFANHSQGNLLTLSGMEYINAKGDYEDGGFKDIEYFVVMDENNEKDYRATPTVAGFGSPVNTTDMDKVVQNAEFEFIGNKTNPNDFVGGVLGGNEGQENGGQDDDRGWMRLTDPLNPETYIDAVKLFAPIPLILPDKSPHSDYSCGSLNGAKCGPEL